MKPSHPLSVFIALCLVLAACGSKSEKVQSGIGQTQGPRKSVKAATVPTYLLNQEEFRDYCANLGGRLDRPGETCLTRTFHRITPMATPAELLINAALAKGTYLFSQGGGSNSVSILLDGRPLMNVPARLLNQVHTGKLTFFINNSDFTEASVTIWSCQDRNRNRVLCAPNSIPGN